MQNRSARQMRVFISSTFRDMQLERDYLVKFIFPQLRKLCEQRDVTWHEVDLRWGITEEQSDEGQVLPICLEEIQRCRPYFIGLLGERYGWIPTEIAPELVKNEPWLGEHKGHSVTELEILYGVLNNPDMSNHAFFYFRDPDCVEQLDPVHLQNFIEVPWREEIEKLGMTAAKERVIERNNKLRVLKERIRKSAFPVKENYQNPQQLGEWLLADFRAVIEDLFPEGSQPDPLEKERLIHETFANNRAKIYIGGSDYFERLNMHVGAGKDPLAVLGESGSGKSALLAKWAQTYQAEHPEVFVLTHFIGASASSVDWAKMLVRIITELKEKFALDGDIPDTPEKLRADFPGWLRKANAKGKVVLVLDALNQLADRQGAQELTWMPAVLPDNIKMVISTTPGKTLDVIRVKNWPLLEVQPLREAEKIELVAAYLEQYSKQLSAKRVQRIVSWNLSDNPLALRILLEELRQFGEHEKLDEFIEHYQKATSIPELFILVLQRCEEDFEIDRPGLVRDAMRYLWAGRRGLSEAELLDLLGSDGNPLPQRVWSPLYLALEQSILDRGGLLDFFHEYMRQAVEEKYLVKEDEKTKVHINLADYFSQIAGNPNRKVEELPWQLVQAKHWQGLYDLLADMDFFQALFEHNRFDLLEYWALIESKSDHTRVQAFQEVLDHPDQFDEEVISWLAAIFYDAGFLREAMVLNKEQERLFRQNSDLEGLERILGNQAVILSDWGEMEEAMRLYQEQEAICRQIEDLDGLQSTLGYQSMILRDWGELEDAMLLSKNQEMICRQTGNLEGLFNSLGNQAVILKIWGMLDEAMELHAEEERICRELENLDGLQVSLGNQALIHKSLGELNEAMALLEEQEQICRKVGNLAGLQTSLGNQANIFYSRGELDTAMELNKEKERICRQLDLQDGLQRTLGNQAVILKKWGKNEEALELMKEQERICRELDHIEGLCTTLVNQGILFNEMEDRASALDAVERSLALAERYGFTTLAAQVANIYERLK